MKLRRLFYTLSLLFVNVFCFAQLQIEGDLRLGDTTQTHILYTVEGDRMAGQVISMDNDQLSFLFRKMTPLTFTFNQIEKIVVEEAVEVLTPDRQPEEKTVEITEKVYYEIKTSEGLTYTGQIPRLNKDEIRLVQEGQHDLYLSFEKIKKISLIQSGDGITSGVNQVLITDRGDRFEGRLMSYESEQLRFTLRNGTVLTFRLRSISTITTRITGSEETTPQETPRQELPSNKGEFIYRISADNDKVYIGQLLKLNSREISLEQSGRLDLYLSMDQVNKIELISDPVTPENQPFKYHHVLTTGRNDRFEGQLLSLDQESFKFYLKNGAILRFTLKDIKEIKLIPIDEEFRTTVLPTRSDKKIINTQQRVFYSPSAFLLKQGEREYRNTAILYNAVDFGISDNVNMGIGLIPFVIANIITAKLKIGASLSNNLHVAVGGHGLFGFSAIDGGGTVGLALFYGALTLGDHENYFSVSAGRGDSTDSYGGSTTGLGFGGGFKIAENWRMVLEYMALNNFFDQRNGFGTLGVSWHKNNNQVDFGFMVIPIYDETYLPLPTAGYSYKF